MAAEPSLSGRDDQRRLEALLADALVRGDLAALRAGARSLPEPLRRAADAIDGDGFAVASLLVARLRFTRVMQGSRRANEWFARDPRAFTDAFRDYHSEVPPTAHDPWREAELFEDWCRAAD